MGKLDTASFVVGMNAGNKDLKNQINDETVARKAGDTSLQNQINSLASGSPKGSYANASALVTANPDTGVYVAQDNGHIYSWTKNGANAIDLGVYQATELERGSVKLTRLSNEVTGNAYHLTKNGSYPNIRFDLANPMLAKDITSIKWKFKIKVLGEKIGANFYSPYGNRWWSLNFFFNPNINYWDLPLNEVKKIELENNNITSTSTQMVNFIDLGFDINQVKNFNHIVYDVELYINGIRQDITLNNYNNCVVDETEEINFLASKEYADTKVPKEDGKGLSTNDYTMQDKVKVNELGYGTCINVNTSNAFYKSINFKIPDLTEKLGISQSSDVTDFKWRLILRSNKGYLKSDSRLGIILGTYWGDMTIHGCSCSATEKNKNEILGKMYYYESDTYTVPSSNIIFPNHSCGVQLYFDYRWSGEFDVDILMLEIIINGKIVTGITNDNLVEKSDTTVTNFDKSNIISYDFVKEMIENEKIEKPKTNFTLPFVNNLYVVKGSKRHSSVPIFVDYLYNGNSKNMLFEDGKDRSYINEYQGISQPNDILNTKETLKFISDDYNVSDVNFNKLSINESVPNGDIKILIIGDSVTAGAITNKTYWEVCAEEFIKEDIDINRTSNINFLGSINNKNVSGSYNNTDYNKQVCACGISSTSLNWWMTNSNSQFVYTDNGETKFSILKWIERYRNYDDNMNKLSLDDSNIGTNITSLNINNIICCAPNIIYINHTHNGGTISEYESCIETIKRELPNCKIIIGAGMPLLGTWHKERYVGKDWISSDNITGPNYNWGGAYGTSRIQSMTNWCNVEKGMTSLNGNTYSNIYYMPQIVITPTIEAFDFNIVDCGIKEMKQIAKLNQLPKEHPGTLAHRIYGYELYALLKFIQGVNNSDVTNNFDTVPLYDTEKNNEE